ncbi:hypothetical protein [uncultured Winogradskyella sp.]|uniref:hypothetical protein n=1 Tax=uncultured Winogradskyella sp. TaxID=395353 RepID=UPI00262D570C|nr:hypothetical protein [uncultured Winogradskyella sp.]
MTYLKRLKKKINAILGRDILFPQNKVLEHLFSSYSTGYILGSAPSINQLDLTKLDKKSLVISMGNFHEHKDIKIINPQIHVFAASHSPITEEVFRNWFKRAELKLPKQTIIMVEIKDFELAKQIFKARDVYPYAYGGELPIDFTKRIISPTTIPMIAIQLGYYIGLEELNLLGIDHNWQNTEGYLHFYSHDEPSLEYYLKESGVIRDTLAFKGRQSKERLYSFYKTYKLFESFKNLNNNRNFKIFNADPNSYFDAFDKKEIDL